jgi:tRNA threonylcarbamoyl adenosine modification protein YeaZ
VLTLAFDTATNTATSALVWDGEVLGELVSRPVSVLEDVDALLRRGGVRPHQLEGIVVGTGPGSFTGIRMGIATARALSFALGVPIAGVSTLEALAAGAPGALPVIDARRREVFVLDDGPALGRPDDFDVTGRVCIGDGAVRYRAILEERGAEIPHDSDERHLPRARFHVQLAHDFGAADDVEPIYLRVPDAEKARR